MKPEKSFYRCIRMMVAAAVVLFAGGCFDSGSDSKASPESEVIETQMLGVYTKNAPGELTQSTYRISGGKSGYARFYVTEHAAIGYMISDGTVKIYDADGSLVHSDIFFPVGNSYKIISLDAGEYLINVQNSVNDDCSFTIFSDAMGLHRTTIRSSGRVLVPGNTHEFIEIEPGKKGARFRASLSTGSLTLFDRDFNRLESTAGTINRQLSGGQYILLADHAESQTFGKLEITME